VLDAVHDLDVLVVDEQTGFVAVVAGAVRDAAVHKQEWSLPLKQVLLSQCNEVLKHLQTVAIQTVVFLDVFTQLLDESKELCNVTKLSGYYLAEYQAWAFDGLVEGFFVSVIREIVNIFVRILHWEPSREQTADEVVCERFYQLAIQSQGDQLDEQQEPQSAVLEIDLGYAQEGPNQLHERVPAENPHYLVQRKPQVEYLEQNGNYNDQKPAQLVLDFVFVDVVQVAVCACLQHAASLHAHVQLGVAEELTQLSKHLKQEQIQKQVVPPLETQVLVRDDVLHQFERSEALICQESVVQDQNIEQRDAQLDLDGQGCLLEHFAETVQQRLAFQSQHVDHPEDLHGDGDEQNDGQQSQIIDDSRDLLHEEEYCIQEEGDEGLPVVHAECGDVLTGGLLADHYGAPIGILLVSDVEPFHGVFGEAVFDAICVDPAFSVGHVGVGVVLDGVFVAAEVAPPVGLYLVLVDIGGDEGPEGNHSDDCQLQQEEAEPNRVFVRNRVVFLGFHHTLRAPLVRTVRLRSVDLVLPAEF